MLRANVAELARKQRGVFTWAQAIVEYTTAEAQTLVAKGEWVRVFRGVYRERTTPLSPGLSVEAARLSMGVEVAVACYSTAAALHGFAVVEDPVTHALTFDERMSRSGRLSVHRDNVVPSSVAARTAVDMARIQNRLDAIATLDLALRTGVPRDLLRDEVSRQVGKRGFARHAS